VDANADLTRYASFRATRVFLVEALVNSPSGKAAESDQTGTDGNIGWQIDRQVRPGNGRSSARLIWVSVSGMRVAFMSLPSVMQSSLGNSVLLVSSIFPERFPLPGKAAPMKTCYEPRALNRRHTGKTIPITLAHAVAAGIT